MISYILNHFPDYMDVRTTLKIVLSDDLEYRSYVQVPSSQMSSWYDPTQDRAFTTSKIEDVPEEFRSQLIQHDNATGTDSTMYPNLTATTKKSSATKTFQLPTMPTFIGTSSQCFGMTLEKMLWRALTTQALHQIHSSMSTTTLASIQ